MADRSPAQRDAKTRRSHRSATHRSTIVIATGCSTWSRPICYWRGRRLRRDACDAREPAGRWLEHVSRLESDAGGGSGGGALGPDGSHGVVLGGREGVVHLENGRVGHGAEGRRALPSLVPGFLRRLWLSIVRLLRASDLWGGWIADCDILQRVLGFEAGHAVLFADRGPRHVRARLRRDPTA